MKNIRIGILGLGYVGLPLAIEFGKLFDVIGYDTNTQRIDNLKKKIDKNRDITKKNFKDATYLNFTDKVEQLKNCNVYIITVPTPINKSKKPNLNLVKNACKLIGKLIKKNDIVILESTVYPGVSEDICAPIIQKISKLKFNIDFFMGYSPERINPNDKKHRISDIVKITSGSTKETSIFVDKLYRKIIKVGTYNAKNIKVAEAAKVIENSQRDLNIAFMNELCLIFEKLSIDTTSVLNAAATKWNFINFKPGIVGGHCIGVDPYYLTYKSKKMGYSPKIINAGRYINDNFTNYIINKAIRKTKKIFKIKNLRFLILGLTFKENCVDFRNSKSIEIFNKLTNKNYETHAFDPLINIIEFNDKNKIKIKKEIKTNYYHCCIISVGHNYFKKLGDKKIRKFLVKNGLIFDIKNILPKNEKNIYL